MIVESLRQSVQAFRYRRVNEDEILDFFAFLDQDLSGLVRRKTAGRPAVQILGAVRLPAPNFVEVAAHQLVQGTCHHFLRMSNVGTIESQHGQVTITWNMMMLKLTRKTLQTGVR